MVKIAYVINLLVQYSYIFIKPKYILKPSVTYEVMTEGIVIIL